MNIMICTVGSEGDVRPLVALAFALSKAKHKVHFMTTPNNNHWFQDSSITFYPIGNDFKKFVQENSVVMGNPLQALLLFIKRSREGIDEQITAIHDVPNSIDCIIGASLFLVGTTFAEYHKVPFINIVFSTQTIESSYYSPMTFPFTNTPRWLNKLLWLSHRDIGNRIAIPYTNKKRKALGLGKIKDFWRNVSQHTIVATDSELFPLPEDVVFDCLQTGYCHLTDDEELSGEITTFLEAGPTPIYIGFGSLSDPTLDKTTKIVLETIEALNIRAIISSGWGGLGETISGNSNILVVSHTPHQKLFPKVAAVVHHGGSGTTHTTARAGVPQVIIPHLLDQYQWGEIIYSLGIGSKPIKKEKMTTEKLTQALKTVLENDDIKKKAYAIGEKLQKKESLTETVKAIEEMIKRCSPLV